MYIGLEQRPGAQSVHRTVDREEKRLISPPSQIGKRPFSAGPERELEADLKDLTDDLRPRRLRREPLCCFARARRAKAHTRRRVGPRKTDSGRKISGRRWAVARLDPRIFFFHRGTAISWEDACPLACPPFQDSPACSAPSLGCYIPHDRVTRGSIAPVSIIDLSVRGTTSSPAIWWT